MIMGGGHGHAPHAVLRTETEGKLSPTDIITSYTPDLEPFENVYKHLHQYPGLSLQENLAADTAAAHLRQLEGFQVTTHIGGTGVIGVLRNGDGKTVILRADTDALPLEELTGLPYASNVRVIDIEDGIEKPVMHACGHDMHVTCMLTAATTLHAAQKHWSGTLVVLFQPNEERGEGAKAMIEDGLYDTAKHACPLPDVVLGQHITPSMAGTVGTRRGPFMSSSDSFEVTLYGKGGHSSQPHACIDPVVMAAHIIVRLQTIVSRESNPQDTVVVTVASIHAGMAENVISDHAVLKINVRTINPVTRSKVLASVRRVIDSECEASGAPKAAQIIPFHSYPLTNNDEKITTSLEASFRKHFGDNYNSEHIRLSGSEDVSILATEAPNKQGGKGVPYSFWVFGGSDPEKWKEADRKGTLGTDIASNHSAKYAPAIQPTLKTGAETMVVAALSFLS